MTDAYWKAAQTYADPMGHLESRREADAQELAERRRRAAEHGRAEQHSGEAQRKDTVTTHTAEVRLSEVFTGGVARDKTGSLKLDAEGRPLPWDPHEQVPDRLDKTQTALLFGVAPEPKRNREPTAEEQLAAAAKQAERERKREAIRSKFDAVLARKEAQEGER